jgi:hypothetical protein
MKRIWYNNKIWILIGIAYTGFYFFKGLKAFIRFGSRIQKKIANYNKSSITKVPDNP